MAKEKSKISLVWTKDAWECDDCGYIEDDELEVFLNDKLIWNGVRDGHLGAYDEISDPLVVLKNVLEALGYEVETEEHG